MRSPTGWVDPLEPDYWSAWKAWHDALQRRADQREAELAALRSAQEADGPSPSPGRSRRHDRARKAVASK